MADLDLPEEDEREFVRELWEGGLVKAALAALESGGSLSAAIDAAGTSVRSEEAAAFYAVREVFRAACTGMPESDGDANGTSLRARLLSHLSVHAAFLLLQEKAHRAGQGADQATIGKSIALLESFGVRQTAEGVEEDTLAGLKGSDAEVALATAGGSLLGLLATDAPPRPAPALVDPDLLAGGSVAGHLLAAHQPSQPADATPAAQAAAAISRASALAAAACAGPQLGGITALCLAVREAVAASAPALIEAIDAPGPAPASAAATAASTLAAQQARLLLVCAAAGASVLGDAAAASSAAASQSRSFGSAEQAGAVQALEGVLAAMAAQAILAAAAAAAHGHVDGPEALGSALEASHRALSSCGAGGAEAGAGRCACAAAVVDALSTKAVYRMRAAERAGAAAHRPPAAVTWMVPAVASRLLAPLVRNNEWWRARPQAAAMGDFLRQVHACRSLRRAATRFRSLATRLVGGPKKAARKSGARKQADAESFRTAAASLEAAAGALGVGRELPKRLASWLERVVEETSLSAVEQSTLARCKAADAWCDPRLTSDELLQAVKAAFEDPTATPAMLAAARGAPVELPAAGAVEARQAGSKRDRR